MNARIELNAAMDAADRAQLTIPCKANPVLWSDDVITRYTERLLVNECRRCPVLDTCANYVAESIEVRRSLNGVVAGRLFRDGRDINHRIPNQPPHPTVQGHYIGRISLHRAIALLDAGHTHAEIAEYARVQPVTVTRAFDRLHARLEAKAS